MRDETDDIDWSGSEKAAAVGLGPRLEKLAKLWEPKDEAVMSEGLDLSPGGADSPEGQLKSAFDKASINPEEVPSAATGDEMPRAGEKPPRPTEPWAAIKYDLEQNANQKPAADPLAEKMKAAGWAPKESSPPPDWEALQRNLQHAQDTANATRLGQQSFAAVSGFHADPNAGAADIASAKAPLEIAQERQRFEAGQQASQAAQVAEHEKLLAEKKEQDRNDPNSDLSKRAREEMRPILMRAGGIPDNYDATWTAADVDKHSNLITPIAGQLTQEHIAKGREDAAAAEKKAAQDAKDKDAATKAATEKTAVDALRETAKKSPRLSELGVKPEDLDGLDRKALEELDRNLRDLPNKKPGAGGPVVHIKPGDYSGIPEGDRETVKAIVEGRAKAPDPGSRYGSKILNYVTSIDPHFDSTRYGAYKGVVEHQANDKDIVAAETAQKHIQQARKNIPENFDSQMLNRIRQAVLTGSGSDQMTPFEVDVKVAADEYAKALGNNAQGGRQEIEHLLGAAQSPAQLAKALDEVDHLLSTKQQTWKDQLSKVAPKGQPETRKIKGGGTAYRGLKSGEWFDNQAEAERN